MLIAKMRPDLRIIGVDVETGMIFKATQTASKTGWRM
jgi:hypothetical protein